ncbi:MAG: hypothetical protein SGBAC_010283 [Bacillariaceae sp.]
MNTLERAHSACVMAQRLNNKAATEIENGAYDRAVRTLNHALRLSRADFRQSQTAHIFMLEACISYSQSASPVSPVGPQPETTVEEDRAAAEQGNQSGLVIYQQTLRVPPEYMTRPMGRILPLLVMYNMALANQLKSTQEDTPADHKRALLNRSLQVYELAYRWQNKEEHKSLRFNMILVNNIGDIHRRVNNRSKCQRCMRQLMRTMMYVQVTDGGEDSRLIPIMETFRRNIKMSGAGAA